MKSEIISDPAQFNLDVYNKSPSRIEQKKMDIFDLTKTRKSAERWNNKNYPHTAAENKQILRNYFELCKRYSVTPIVVIFPVTKMWQEFFSKQKLDEVYSLLSELHKQYNFHFLNGLQYEGLIESQDFSDSEHLNDLGAKKFSKYINDYIMQLEYHRIIP